jgi:hypothetical protein
MTLQDAKPRILVVCEGEVTEPAYIEALRSWSRNPRVEIVVEPKGGVPMSLIARAIELKTAADRRAKQEKDENLIYEEVWCVFDVDEHPRVEDARFRARQAGLRLAMSNPCFELWLYLHFAESPGLQHRHDLQKMLRRRMPSPPTAKTIDPAALRPGIRQAILRAERLERDATQDGEPTRNPTTEVFKLVRLIDADQKFERDQQPDI